MHPFSTLSTCPSKSLYTALAKRETIIKRKKHVFVDKEEKACVYILRLSMFIEEMIMLIIHDRTFLQSTTNDSSLNQECKSVRAAVLNGEVTFMPIFPPM